MLKLRDISFSYGKKKILSRLSLELGKGECLVLAGPNGSGKSTALSLMAGVLSPESGSIEAEGRIGYVPQGTALFEDMSVADNLAFFAGLAGCAVPDVLSFGLGAMKKTRVSRLSGGMKKLLSIACGMLGQPDILLLDEPCAGLDVEHRMELSEELAKLKAEGTTLVYVSHEPSEFEDLYDKLVFLGSGVQSFTRENLSVQTQGGLNAGFRALFVNEK